MAPTYRLIAKHKASFHEPLHILTLAHEGGPSVGPDPLVLALNEKVSELVKVGEVVTFEQIGEVLPQVKEPAKRGGGK